MKIPMEKIISTPDRDQGDITSLANSIQQVGLLQPIILKENMDGTYTVVDGRRRFAAMQKLWMEVLQDSQFAFHNSGRIDVLAHVANTERKQLTAAEQHDYMDRAIIAIPEPKSLTEARKAAAKDGNTKGGK